MSIIKKYIPDSPASGKNTLQQSDAQHIETIRSVIRSAGDDARRRYPILANQNLIGMSVFLFAISAILLTGFAYWQGMISAWLCIPTVAFLTSLLHELEHDLIHWQYFKNNKLIHHLMMAGVWIFRVRLIRGFAATCIFCIIKPQVPRPTSKNVASAMAAPSDHCAG